MIRGLGKKMREELLFFDKTAPKKNDDIAS